MTTTQVTAVSDALTTTTGSVLDSFISILPAIGIIVGTCFVISFVLYWIKKLRRVR